MREVKELTVKGNLAHYVVLEDGVEVRQVDRDVSAEQAEARQKHEALQNVLERYENAVITEPPDDHLELAVSELADALKPLPLLQEKMAAVEGSLQSLWEREAHDVTSLTARLTKAAEHAEDRDAHKEPEDVQPIIHALRQEIMEMRGLLSRLSMDVGSVAERLTSHPHNYAGLKHPHAEFEEIATLKEQARINAENIATVARGYSTLEERLRQVESHNHDERYALQAHPHSQYEMKGHKHEEKPHVHEATTRKTDGWYCICGEKVAELETGRRGR